MKINRDNYELYFIDFLDGKLDSETIEEVKHFLHLNSDLQAEFDELTDLEYLSPSKTVFPDKELIKKPESDIVNTLNYEHFMVAVIEGDASDAEAEGLNKFLVKNPVYNSDYSLFKKTIIKPDFSVEYPDKAALKRLKFAGTFTVHIRTFYRIAAAASITLLAGLFFLNRHETSHDLAEGLSVQQSGFVLPFTTKSNYSSITSGNNEIKTPDNQTEIKNNSTTANSETASFNNAIDKAGMLRADAAGLPEYKDETYNEKCNIIKNHLSINYKYIADYSNNIEVTDSDSKNENSLGLWAFSWLKKRINTTEENNEQKIRTITWFEIAGLGIDGINKVTSSELKLDKTDRGPFEANGFSLAGNNFRLSGNRGRK